MADQVTIRVQGLATLDAALRDLPVAVRKEVLAPALADAGEVIKRGAQERIRNRSGRTDADLRVTVEVKERENAGRAMIGGDKRAHILKFLEFGTKPHAIPKKTRGTRTRRRRKGKPAALSFGGKVFSRVQHPGIAAQSPLRSALKSEGPRAVQVFARRAWEGIRAAAARLSGKR